MRELLVLEAMQAEIERLHQDLPPALGAPIPGLQALRTINEAVQANLRHLWAEHQAARSASEVWPLPSAPTVGLAHLVAQAKHTWLLDAAYLRDVEADFRRAG